MVTLDFHAGAPFSCCGSVDSLFDRAFNQFNEGIPASFDLPNTMTVGAVDQGGDEAAFTSEYRAYDEAMHREV